MMNAVLATLNGVANVRAYLGEAPSNPTYPLVVVFPAPGRTQGVLSDRLRDLVVDFQTTTVGTTAEQAIDLNDAIHSALDGVAPTVAGRVSYPIYQESQPQPVRRDDTLLDPRFYAVTLWRFQTSI
jgi:hypothetical protein